MEPTSSSVSSSNYISPASVIPSSVSSTTPRSIKLSRSAVNVARISDRTRVQPKTAATSDRSSSRRTPRQSAMTLRMASCRSIIGICRTKRPPREAAVRTNCSSRAGKSYAAPRQTTAFFLSSQRRTSRIRTWMTGPDLPAPQAVRTRVNNSSSSTGPSTSTTRSTISATTSKASGSCSATRSNPRLAADVRRSSMSSSVPTCWYGRVHLVGSCSTGANCTAVDIESSSTSLDTAGAGSDRASFGSGRPTAYGSIAHAAATSTRRRSIASLRLRYQSVPQMRCSRQPRSRSTDSRNRSRSRAARDEWYIAPSHSIPSCMRP